MQKNHEKHLKIKRVEKFLLTNKHYIKKNKITHSLNYTFIDLKIEL